MKEGICDHNSVPSVSSISRVLRAKFHGIEEDDIGEVEGDGEDNSHNYLDPEGSDDSEEGEGEFSLFSEPIGLS